MPQTGNIPAGVPHPTRSLGYQIIRWAQKYIVQPDGENAGQPWKFTAEQLRFVLWMYAIDENGRWLYRTAALRRAKGWGLARHLFSPHCASLSSSARPVSRTSTSAGCR